MRLSRTWIDTELSHDERTRLIDWLCERSSNPTGELIRTGIEELFPGHEPPSVQSCITWRNRSWEFEMHRRELKAESEAARVLADAGQGSFAEANRVLVEQALFEQLRALKEGKTVDSEALHDWILSAARMAQSSRREKELTAKLEEIERQRERERAKIEELQKTVNSGVTPETMKKVREQIGLL